MSALVRLRRGLFEEVTMDLRRPHAFAYERVGFLYGPIARLSEARILILPARYEPVPDDEYVDDHRVGACINRSALHRALQRVLATGDCCLHVHMHAHRGVPGPSPVDRDMLRNFAPSLQAVGATALHGGLILSEDRATALLWSPEHERLEGGRVNIIGTPTWISPVEKGGSSWA